MLGAFPQVAAGRGEDIYDPFTIFGTTRLVQFHHADHCGTLVSGRVHTWPDLSGHGWDSTTTTSNAAVGPDAALGGRNSVVFDGINDEAFSGLMFGDTTSDPYTLISIYTPITLPSIKVPFGSDITNGPASGTFLQTSGGSVFALGTSTQTTFNIFGPMSFTLGQYGLMVVSFSGDTGSGGSTGALDWVKWGTYNANNGVGYAPADTRGRHISGFTAARANIGIRSVMHVKGVVTAREVGRLQRWVARDCGPGNVQL